MKRNNPFWVWDQERCEYVNRKTGEGSSVGIGDNVRKEKEDVS